MLNKSELKSTRNKAICVLVLASISFLMLILGWILPILWVTRYIFSLVNFILMIIIAVKSSKIDRTSMILIIIGIFIPPVGIIGLIILLVKITSLLKEEDVNEQAQITE
ncbi:hypothetical protein [Mycoplasma anserisalpingitidis]|uniref:hypothetical protein n=1 Tax=Mycoplasma anserisalpingitidis TaxID=519450 RepID=UPI001CF66F30|nr:hypothetical protein [Mycoplasma anserisalpingitidis]UCU26555.1 hypothetical protein K7D06_03075 [Mycoplasma anserisalpingitidis]UCU27392.1 hypothetical protein K9O38_03740 [Mycoplasma anserisalpingitidis]